MASVDRYRLNEHASEVDQIRTETIDERPDQGNVYDRSEVYARRKRWSVCTCRLSVQCALALARFHIYTLEIY